MSMMFFLFNQSEQNRIGATFFFWLHNQKSKKYDEKEMFNVEVLLYRICIRQDQDQHDVI